MSDQSFVHLRMHSDFSLIDGIVRVKPLIKTLAEQGMGACALTDIQNLFALVKFYSAAKGAGIKPIIGADLWLENEDDLAKPFLQTVLVQNQQGYLHLMELLSQGYQLNQQHDRALIKKHWLAEKNQGLILLSGHQSGDLAEPLLRNNPELALERARYWQSVFEDRYVLELQRVGRAEDEALVQAQVALAAQLGLAVVATNAVVFLQQEDFEAHEVRVCINDSVVQDDPKRPRKYTAEQYLKTPAQMQQLFADIPSAISNSLELARRCTVNLRMGEYFLPNYPVPEGLTMDQYFRELSHQGLSKRLDFFAQQGVQLHEPDYRARLDFELDVIIQMGFPGYFLIVMDFIRWAKEHDIPVGPGRGSGAGSLVAYSLDITDLDPLQYDLLFERFLNPERVSMPDFDIDFCMEKRDRVISYVADTYGRDAVGQIVTFGTMAAKAVVRDVARVQGKSYSMADRISKMIPSTPGTKLADAIAQVPELVQMLDSDEAAAEVWQMAVKLEGITRQTGKHAGGVVISPTKLSDFSPLYCDADGSGLVTQYDKNDVETVGLVKFDFLGLRTLTIIDWALKIINDKGKQQGLPLVDINTIPLDDPACFELLKQSKTTAVFQLESRGMKDLIKRLQPSSLEDMIALVALYRPGPLESGMVEDFIDRKHLRQPVAYPHVDYQHPDLEPVLENTYGIILYQEQVMQIAQVLAGFSLGGADMLRRAMGKKKPEEMVKQRELFLQGAQGRGIDTDLANNIFDLMEKFAGYGFNKSHSAAYALVSYQTLWLKTHYPAAFMAATLSADLDNTDKVVGLIEECRQLGLTVLPPDVNAGSYSFTVNDQDQVVYGLGAVKGVGEGPVAAITQAREQGGKFTDLFDFCARMDSRKINKRTLEALIRSGALDSLAEHRGILLSAMEDAMRAAEQKQQNESLGMVDLFADLMQPEDPYLRYAKAALLTPKEILDGERDTLGLYLTGHPIDEHEELVKQVTSLRLQDINAHASEAQQGGFQFKGIAARVAGLVTNIKRMRNKQNEPMAFVTLDDRTGRTEITLSGELLQQVDAFLQPDAVLLAEGVLRWSDYNESMKLRVNSLMPLAQARAELTREVLVKMSLPSEQLNQLLPLLGDQGLPVRLHCQASYADFELQLPADMRLLLSDDNYSWLQRAFGAANIRLVL